MTRHPFRWEGLAFGLFFFAVVGSWAVWKQDLLTPHQLSLTASLVLIILGLIGIAATVGRSRAPMTTRPIEQATTEGPHHEEADPQS